MHSSTRRHLGGLGAPALGTAGPPPASKRSGNHWGAPSSTSICRRVAAMFSTLDWAVKGATGSSRSTVPNEIECARRTAADIPFGDWKFDYREFHPIYPPPAENAGGVAPGAPTLEAEIAALVQEAQESLRQPDDEDRDAGQDLQRQAAVSGDVREFSATLPKNIAVRVNWPGLERHPWDPDIRINDPVRAREAVSSRNAQTRPVVFAVLLGTSLAAAWIVGLPPSLIQGRHPTALDQTSPRSGESLDSNGRPTLGRPEANWEAVPRLGNTGRIAGPAPGVPSRRREFAPSAPQQPKPVRTALLAPPSAGPSEPATSSLGHRPDFLPRPAPFPETKPDTVDGWIVRDVFGGTAVLEGPDGVRRAARGDSVPGLGRLESIVRWGNRWIVVTDRGLISTP